ncbi:Rid family hydrolase [Allomeiothermus silvanus]|uniref:Rid family hydrolase n=1 Tax=Allomeiothermus silvanus TaxID=52022 RepID=UPI0023F1A7B0|nr:Rid family hydrolase [Allomeiothermus silvanus]
MERQRYLSGVPWESTVGYSGGSPGGQPHPRLGDHRNQGKRRDRGNGRLHSVQTLRNIEKALGALGAGLEHVVRTRIFVTNIEDWEKVGRAHGEFFGRVKPATAMVEVSRLIDSRMLVEIEAEAYLGDNGLE